MEQQEGQGGVEGMAHAIARLVRLQRTGRRIYGSDATYAGHFWHGPFVCLCLEQGCRKGKNRPKAVFWVG